MFWVFMVLTLVFDLGGIVLGRLAAERKQPAYFVACIVAFTFVGLFVACMMQYRGVAIVTIVWAGLAPVLALLVGYYCFDEHFNFWQFVGTALIIIGVTVVEWPREKPQSTPTPDTTEQLVAQAPQE